MVTVVDGTILPWTRGEATACPPRPADHSPLGGICASLAARGNAPTQRDATVRWALLVGDIIRFSREAHAPRPAPRRRIGEPALPPTLSPSEDGTPPLWLTALHGQVLGIVARHCAIGACCDAPPFPVTQADALEAGLMLDAVDALLGRHLDWAGRHGWRVAPLAPLVTARTPAAEAANRIHLQAHLMAGDCRFLAALPVLQRLDLPGTGSALPCPPATPDMVLPSPISAPPPPASRRRKSGWWMVAAGAATLIAVLTWQHVLWRGFAGDLAARIGAGG